MTSTPKPAHRRGHLVLVALTAISVAACSHTVGGTPTPDAAALLDTGNYPTAPRAITAQTPADAWQQEAFRMADAVVAPWDIDPRYTALNPDDGLFLHGPIVAAIQLAGPDFLFLSADQLTDLTPLELRAGYIAVGMDPTSPANGLRVGMIRFKDASAARAAVDVMTIGDAEPDPVPGAAASRILKDDGAGGLYAARTRGDLVIFASVSGIDAPEKARALLARTLNAQYEKASTYDPTPDSDGIPAVPMDVDGIMARTLPSNSATAAANKILRLSDGFRPGDGYRSVFANHFVERFAQLTDSYRSVGVERVGTTNFSTVAKASSAAGAARLQELWYDSDERSCVTGIPDEVIRCDLENGLCSVRVGVWVARVANKTAQNLRQMCAAEYLILRAAGQ